MRLAKAQEVDLQSHSVPLVRRSTRNALHLPKVVHRGGPEKKTRRALAVSRRKDTGQADGGRRNVHRSARRDPVGHLTDHQRNGRSRLQKDQVVEPALQECERKKAVVIMKACGITTRSS
ncbi:hypothetical protein MTO96_038889 [Rhipicephalus appendiculatus]